MVAERFPTPPSAPEDATRLADPAVALVRAWVERAEAATTPEEARSLQQIHGVVADRSGVDFAMRFVDRVIRPENDAVAAQQLVHLLEAAPLPGFLSSIDQLLLRLGALVAPLWPSLVMPLARRRLRQLVGHLVIDAQEKSLEHHLKARRSEDYRLNVNPLGEAVLGHREAEARRTAATELLSRPEIDYVSVKVSAIAAQLSPWDFEDAVHRVIEQLRPLLLTAAQASPPTFVNLDMEEYRDLEMTVAAFTRLLDEPALHPIDAGIVLQAYLPDTFPVLQHLVDWAAERHRRQRQGRPGGKIKIRLVKGANLAMERVDASIHGWTQAPYHTKHETDANYKRCLDWVLTPERMEALRIGVASHNLFDVAWAHLLSSERGVADRVEFEMLEGMAPGISRVVRDDGEGMLLYTPVVAPTDFDVTISYLFRRLEENASDENFIRHLFDLEPGSEAFAREEAKFRASLEDRKTVGAGPQRTSVRPATAAHAAKHSSFVNEPDTDPTLAAHREWALEVSSQPYAGPMAPLVTERSAVDAELARVRAAFPAWSARSAEARRTVLHEVADALARRRGDLISAMVHEGKKTFAQADPEVSEAIDFARWYGDRAVELESPGARFEPLGVLAVVPPWNFPVAIPAGGVLAALASGNTVVLKPAPQTPRCAEIVAECCWSAGVPREALAFVRTPDDEVGRHLVTHDEVDAVILTGAYETAELFRSWRPDLTIFAETSGKNALIITENADLDEAVKDLVDSAFGHSGQKCSAASLGILVGTVAQSGRFQRQLVDTVMSLEVGRPQTLATAFGPVIEAPQAKLTRALTELEPGERWLVQPRKLADDLWTPGVRLGVASGSWFHLNECFGPVLGLMEAHDLDHAIQLQNEVAYGLTGGLHSLDPVEATHWLERVEVGNAYVNRATTGAIVRRQPFGGWKRSSIGPGFKAGGPNYLRQLGRWIPPPRGEAAAFLEEAAASDQAWWDREFGVERDDAGLFCEANIFRYRAVPALGLVGAETDPTGAERIRAAAHRLGVALIEAATPEETARQVVAAGGESIRLLDPSRTAELRSVAHPLGLHVADDAVTVDARIELLHLLREQAISRTLHRHGNLV